MLILAILSLAAAPTTLVITHGRVADGSGGALVQGKVILVRGDTIEAVVDEKAFTPPAGARTIDAKGMVVAPGFIDMHSHADEEILRLPGAETQIRQGITTALGGQDGDSALPLGAFLSRVEEKGTAINLTVMVGFGRLRREVLGADFRRPARSDEIARMQALAREAMGDGAFGLSTGLEYDPDTHAPTDEVVAVAGAVREGGGFYVSHVRDEAQQALRSFAEVVEISERAGLPAQISHVKLASPLTWGQTGRVRALLDDAERRGLRVTADCYPYTFWQATLRAMVVSKNYSDRTAVESGLVDAGGPDAIRITRFLPDRSLQGRTLTEVARLRGVDPVAAMIDLMRAAPPVNGVDGRSEDTEQVIGESMKEEDVRAFYADPRVMVSSDGHIDGTHPRGAGSFPRFLARYVREGKVVSLEEGVRKMTSLPASVLGLADRGRIAAGMKADLVVFDPATVADRSTIQDPWAAPVGLPYVVVNGQVALDDGVATDARAGRVLRHEAHPPPAP